MARLFNHGRSCVQMRWAGKSVAAVEAAVDNPLDGALSLSWSSGSQSAARSREGSLGQGSPLRGLCEGRSVFQQVAWVRDSCTPGEGSLSASTTRGI
eukprot:609518-Pelagomonas_calceolata.AAC.2